MPSTTGRKACSTNPRTARQTYGWGCVFQTRFTDGPDKPATAEDLDQKISTLDLKRGRIKGGGTLLADWLDVYSEYDFTSNTLLDYRATFALNDWLSLRVGQWKSEFNRERVDSSGKQQLVERSIATYWFTVDRQRGVAASARLAEGTPWDSSVWVELLSGQGRGGSFDGGHRLWLGRWQWNPAGEPLPFSQSDLEWREQPLPSVAIAGITGTSPHTRFSSSGGRDLPGFSEGDYRLHQLMLETALHYRGFAWQQELHFKRIEDRDSPRDQEALGGYAQLGTFPNAWWPAMPRPLEVVLRFAVVDPDRDNGDDTQLEWTLGANWFFHAAAMKSRAHRHKLTADVSWLDFDDPGGRERELRFRLQWELSL